jgi:3-keto-disaccharide hydrolase
MRYIAIALIGGSLLLQHDLGARAAIAQAANVDAAAACPKCVRIFDGKTWDGWEHDPVNWSILDGAMRAFGPGSRSAFTKADYGDFRLIVTSRMSPVNNDHLGVLFWGPRPEPGSVAYTKNIQVQPPHGAMWDYYENKALQREVIGPFSRDFESWKVMEILADFETGSLRVAVDGVEISRYKDANPSRLSKGPIAMQKHGAGGSEYKDIFVEANPTEDRLYTVTASK